VKIAAQKLSCKAGVIDLNLFGVRLSVAARPSPRAYSQLASCAHSTFAGVPQDPGPPRRQPHSFLFTRTRVSRL